MTNLVLLTADPALGCRLQLYLESRGYHCNVLYPWTRRRADSSLLTIYDARTTWAREQLPLFPGPHIALAPQGVKLAGNATVVRLPIIARELRLTIARLLGEEDQPARAEDHATALASSVTIGLRTTTAALVEACADRFTGRLEIVGRRRFTIDLIDGQPVCGTSDSRELALDAILLKLGYVTLADLGSAHRRGTVSDAALGDDLVSRGVITAEQHRAALIRQCRAKCVEALGELSAAITRAPMNVQQQGQSSHDCFDLLIEAMELHHGVNELAHRAAARADAGTIVVTPTGWSLDAELRCHPAVGPIWRAITLGDTSVTQLVTDPSTTDLVVICMLFETRLIRSATPSLAERIKATAAET